MSFFSFLYILLFICISMYDRATCNRRQIPCKPILILSIHSLWKTVFTGCGCGSSQSRRCTDVCQKTRHLPGIRQLRGAGQRSRYRSVLLGRATRFFSCTVDFYRTISLATAKSGLFVSVCRCGVCGSYPPLPSEYLSPPHERQEECAVWEAAGHELQGGEGDAGLRQEERRLPHGGVDGRTLDCSNFLFSTFYLQKLLSVKTEKGLQHCCFCFNR